jgi:hypothetical protein
MPPLPGLGLWNLSEMKQRCRVLERIRHSADLLVEDCAAFVYVPYRDYQVPYEAAEAYLRARQGRVAAFLVRVDLSDIRHVVFAFITSADRAAFLAKPGIILPRV